MNTSLSQELIARGFIHQHTNDDLEEILNTTRVIYHGIDPSGDSAHVGHLAVWILLHHLAKAGHQVLFLVGGGTGMIGDPKPDAERTLKSVEEIDKNVNKIKHQAEKIITGEEITFVNNRDWLGKLGLIEFLRDIGKHFTVNELIKKDAINKRLSTETGISYTEFAYPLLQGFDYLQLFEKYHCTLQIGGSDQWGNIIAGVDLIRRKTSQTVHALTVPLVIDKSTGKKFGKSEGNAVWLDPEKTSPYNFYQFWLQVTDINVADYLKIFTFLPLKEIEEIIVKHKTSPEQRFAQKTLAKAITSFIHGAELTDQLIKVSASVFGEVNLEELNNSEKNLLLNNLPVTEIENNSLLLESLVKSQLASSKREARTFIIEKAVSLNHQVTTDLDTTISGESGKLFLLKRGKKHLTLLQIK